MDLNLGISIILFALGVAASWLIARAYYRMGAEVRSLSWSYESEKLIYRREATKHELTLILDGEAVLFPEKGRFVVWNSGNKIITKADISQTDPLLLKLSDARILSMEIADQTRRAITPSFSRISDDSISISFEFLDPGDGFSLDIFQDRSNLERKTTEVLQGTVIGLMHGIQRQFKTKPYRGISVFTLVGTSISFIFFVCCGVLLIYDPYHRWSFDILAVAEIVGGLISLLVGFAFGLFVVSELGDGGIRKPLFIRGRSRVGVLFAGLDPSPFDTSVRWLSLERKAATETDIPQSGVDHRLP